MFFVTERVPSVTVSPSPISVIVQLLYVFPLHRLGEFSVPGGLMICWHVT